MQITGTIIAKIIIAIIVLIKAPIMLMYTTKNIGILSSQFLVVGLRLEYLGGGEGLSVLFGRLIAFA